MLFPGIGLAEDESSWTLFDVTPLAPDRSRVVTRSRLANVSGWAFGRQEWRSYGFWRSGSAANTRAAPTTRWRRATSWPRTSTLANSSRSRCEAPTSSMAPRPWARRECGSTSNSYAPGYKNPDQPPPAST